MKIANLIVVAATAGGLAACSSGNDCTQEVMTKKSQELMTAIQAKMTADPGSAQDLMKRFQDIGTKFQSATDKSQACKAYDELLAAVKK